MLGVVVSSQCVAHNFSELCRSLNVQEHCFSLGPTSRLVASELASMPEARARHKVCVRHALLACLRPVVTLDHCTGPATLCACGRVCVVHGDECMR